MSSILSLFCSMGVVTVCSTTMAPAPGKVVLTATVGGVISGMLSTGSVGMEITPRMMITMEITIAITGRSMKKMLKVLTNPPLPTRAKPHSRHACLRAKPHRKHAALRLRSADRSLHVLHHGYHREAGARTQHAVDDVQLRTIQATLYNHHAIILLGARDDVALLHDVLIPDDQDVLAAEIGADGPFVHQYGILLHLSHHADAHEEPGKQSQLFVGGHRAGIWMVPVVGSTVLSM